MDSMTTRGRQSGVSRRTVVAGAAWAVPAVLLASAVPAMALSGPPPEFQFVSACKIPGGSCQIPLLKHGYKFNFAVTNHSPYTIFVCGAEFTTTPLGDLTWVPPSSGCLEVPPNTPVPVNVSVFVNAENSANQGFTTDMTLTWAHTCPCDQDPDLADHPPVTYTIVVTDTPPDCLTCEGPN